MNCFVGNFKGNATTCYLGEFPDGYKLFTIKKGEEGDFRTDHYLRGKFCFSTYFTFFAS